MTGSTGPGPGPVSGMTQNWLKTRVTATHAQNATRSLATSAPSPSARGGGAVKPVR